MDLRSVQWVEVLLPEVPSGETRQHFPLGPGDVAVAERGEAHGHGMRAAGKQGAARSVRLPPCRGGLCEAAGAA
jgi:hypothetical protein